MNRTGFRFVGFTLVEMIVAILLLGILGAGVAAFLVRPVEGYGDLSRRAALVDAAETALRRMERDLRNALPNSMRVTTLTGGGFAVEVLPVIDGGQYRKTGDAPDPGGLKYLDFGSADTDFDVNGFLARVPVPSSSTTHRIVINNQGSTSANASHDAYQAAGADAVITPLGTTISYTRVSNERVRDHITLTPGYEFYVGPQNARQRFFIVTTPVSYLCVPDATNPVLGTLIRYSDYAINGSSVQPTNPAIAPLATATSTLIVGRLSACTVTVSTSDIKNRMLATFTLAVEEESEKVSLLHQIQVDNSP